MPSLLDVAIQGTAQAGVEHLEVPAPLSELFAPAAMLTVEQRMLIAAGAQAVIQLAGGQSIHCTQRMPIAPPDILPECSPVVAQHLHRVLLLVGHGPWVTECILSPDASHPWLSCKVLAEALGWVSDRSQRLPNWLLPLALASKPPQLRRCLRPVLGERGRWLASFNLEWTWAAPVGTGATGIDVLAAVWNTGTTAERIAALEAGRSIDAGQARGWLESTWHTDPAALRAKSVAALATGLTLADEDFLERALDDRSLEVRVESASLLRTLVGSRFSLRMRERARLLVSGSHKRGKLVLHFHLDPDVLHMDSAARDFVRTSNSLTGSSPAGWIQDVLAATPLAQWEQQLEATPEAITQAACDTDWADALFAGWSLSAHVFGDGSWADLLLPYWWSQAAGPPRTDILGPEVAFIPALVRLLPSNAAERLALSLLDAQEEAEKRHLRQLLESMPQPWSETFGRTYVGMLRAYARSFVNNPPTIGSTELPPNTHIAAVALPPSCFAAALQPWMLPEAKTMASIAWRVGVDALVRIVSIRQSIWEGLP